MPHAFVPRLGLSAILVGASLLAASCGDTTGKQCDANGDCSDGQICAPIVAGCVSANDCPGICGDPCESDDDCEGDETCQVSAGAATAAICREPTDLGSD